MKHIHKILKRISVSRQRENNINTIITVFAVIMIRRWMRWLLDKFLFPNHEIISYLVSITIWIIILRLDDKEINELSSH